MLQDCLITCRLTFERLLENEENQINGFVVIHDLAFFDTQLVTSTTPALIKKALNLMQTGLPTRITKVFIVHQPLAFTALYGMFQTLMKPVMREKTVVAGNEYKRLHDIVDKSVLPRIFMGTGPELDVEKWKLEVLQQHPTCCSVSLV